MAILIGIGANLPAIGYSTPLDTCKAAIERVRTFEIQVVAVSGWYETAPVPVSDQPWFVNAVFSVRQEQGRTAKDLLDALHKIESEFGRVRVERNEARVLDLDLLDYNGEISGPDGWPHLPHPKIAERLFVAVPLRDVAPTWRHPVDEKAIDEIISDLDMSGQRIRSLAESTLID